MKQNKKEKSTFVHMLSEREEDKKDSFSILVFIGCIRTGQLGYHLNLEKGWVEEHSGGQEQEESVYN